MATFDFKRGDQTVVGTDEADLFRLDNRGAGTKVIDAFELGEDALAFRVDGRYFQGTDIATINANQARVSTEADFLELVRAVMGDDGAANAVDVEGDDLVLTIDADNHFRGDLTLRLDGLADGIGLRQLGFDDVPLGGGTEASIASYGGFTWTNAFVVDVPAFEAQVGQDTGYDPRSADNVAFVGFPPANGYQLSFSREADFELLGGWFGAAFKDGLEVKVEAFDDGASLGFETLVLDTDGPDRFAFDFGPADEIVLTADPGTGAGSNPFGDPNYFYFDDLLIA